MKQKVLALLLFLTIFMVCVYASQGAIKISESDVVNPMEASGQVEINYDNLDMEIDSKLDNHKLLRNALNDKKSYVLNNEIRKECIFVEENKIYKLKIHGSVILFSDIPDVEICDGKTKFIELFARDTIIIDKDLIKVEEAVQVVAIAPKMIVVGNRTINLNGAPGKAHDPPSADSGEVGFPGQDGLPGLPGGPGGKFIGVSEIIVNEHLLKIFANGGKGGPGQHGGTGGKGRKGDLPERVVKFGVNTVTVPGSKPSRNPYSSSFDCIVMGKDGKKGENGGNGGIGGMGGKAGHIILHQLKKNLQENKWHTQHGQVGINGRGGSGGPGGEHGGIIRTICHTNTYSVKITGYTANKEIEPYSSSSPTGNNGVSGAISKGREEPIDYKGFRDYPFVLNDYKKYIRPYLAKLKKNKNLITFYSKLINKEEINREYGTLGLLDELKGLEEQYLDLRDSMALVPMYENLKKRIGKYLRHRWTNESDEDYEVALGFAYTAALSKATRLRAISDGNCVIDLKAYLSLVFENLNELKESIVQFTNDKISENYKNNINEKIFEAQSLINEQLKKEIPKIHKLMRHNVLDLIHETSNFNKGLEERKEVLKKAMHQQFMLTILKSTVVAAAALVPGGQVAATVAFTAIEVGSNFIQQVPKDKINAPIAIGKNITIARQILTESRNSSVETLNNQLNYLLEMKAKLHNSSNQTTQIDANITFIKEKVNNLKQEIINLVKEEKEEKVDENTSVNLLSIISKLNIFASFNYTDGDLNDVIDVFKDEQENEEKLENDLESVEGDIKRLKEYEEKVYKEFIPVLRNIEKDLPNNAELSVKSAAGLDISKWKVQEALRKVKLVIKEFTQGFQVADEMNILIESLQNTINTMIDMYNLIQNYQQDKNLAAYIAHLSNLKQFHSENQVLRNAINAADMMIRQNLALIQYKKSIEAFKQRIFPFTEYLDKLNSPATMELLANHSSNFVFSKCSSTIKEMDKMLQEQKSLLSNLITIDEEILPNNITSERPPLFLWKNETHHDMISELLDGNEVILRPNARFYPHNAVKFKTIKITFIPRNESMNETLNMKMQNININMIHEGDSYYKCGQKLYLISHNSFTIVFSSLVNSNTATAIQTGDLSISPFATWRVKLNRGSGGKIPLNYLSQFKNNVDLLLTGNVRYVPNDDYNNNDLCNQRLSKYYEEYVPIV